MRAGAAPPNRRPSTVTRLTPLATALDRLGAQAPLAKPARIPVDQALGAALAEDVVAEAPVPGHAFALRDGWAVVAAETVGASGYSPAFLSAAPALVAAGEPLPPGTDAVLPLSAVDPDGVPACVETAAPWEGARRAGGEVQSTAVLARKSQRVTRALVAALQAAGVGNVAVRNPCVAFAPDLEPVTRSVVAWLVGPSASGALDRKPSPLSLSRPAGEGDAGEAGEGGAREAGAAVLIAPWRPLQPEEPGLLCEALALAPGEATWIAIVDGRAVVRIPPVFGAAVAVTLALLSPALARLAGAQAAEPSRSLPLGRKIASRVGWSELALLGVDDERWTPLAVGDVTISTLARAAAWALVPPESEGAPAGASLAAHLFGADP
ncbi:hypothetical protein [Alsobacter soli]|nr:hypothetical protein [Alsobacter soli]